MRAAVILVHDADPPVLSSDHDNDSQVAWGVTDITAIKDGKPTADWCIIVCLNVHIANFYKIKNCNIKLKGGYKICAEPSGNAMRNLVPLE